MAAPTDPVQVATTGHFRTSEISYFSECAGPKAGPYVVNGQVWIVGDDPFPDTPNNTFIKIFRSDDGGNTFAEADAASHPTAHDRLAATAPPDNGEWRMYDSVLVGTTIYVLYVTAAAALAVAPFDTTGNGGLGTWGAPFTGGPAVEVEPQIFLQYDNEGNQLVVVYQTTLATVPTAILARTVSLVGVWSGATTVQAYGAAQNQLLGIAGGFDGATTYFTQVFFRAIVGTSAVREFRHRSLSTALAVGASQLLDTFTDVGGTVDVLLGSPMSASALNGVKVMAVIWARSSGGASVFSILRSYIASPAALPVWTPADVVAPVIGSVPINYTAIGVGVGGDGTIQLVYSANNFNYRERTFTAGVWSAETTLLDITSGPDFNIALNQVSFLDGGTISNFGYVFTYGLAGNSTSSGDELVAAKLIYKLNVFYFPVGGAPPAVDCDSPTAGQVGVAYSHFFPATGGVEPLVWSNPGGGLPPGLLLDAATGELSGIPTLAGVYPFTIRVTDADLNTDEVECSITIELETLTVSCNNPPVGKLNVVYDHNFTASGGTPPYTFAIVAGSLPPGLSLDASTGEVTGTPTLSGFYEFTVEVTDSFDDTDTVGCSIRIKVCLLAMAGDGG